MHVKLSVIFLFIGNCFAESCDHLGTLLYEELNCKAIKSASSNCPIRYDCDLGLHEDYCVYKSRKYTIGEQIKLEWIYATCNTNCFCTKGPQHADFQCAVLDCPEWMAPPLPSNCHNTYELDKCCATGQFCETPANLSHTCKLNDFALKEGERLWFDDECTQCVCGRDYDRKTLKNCKRVQCGAGLNFYRQANQFCAPVYTPSGPSPAKCCPYEFICPEETEDEIKVVTAHEDAEDGLRCRFGAKELKLGEGFTRHVGLIDIIQEINCECKLPPLLTCTTHFCRNVVKEKTM